MEWLKLWIPFVGTILGIGANVYISFRQSKKQNEFQKKLNHQQQEFQKEMTQKQIDANLKAKARIEWINEVRSLSASIISGFAEIKKNNTHFEDRYLEISKDAELLKLYFGAFEESDSKKIDESILLNKTSNKNKNAHIFKFIDSMLDDYSEFGIKKYKLNLKEYSKYQDEIKRYEEHMMEYCTVETDEFGNLEIVPTDEGWFAHNFYFGEVQELKRKSTKYYWYMREYDSKITMFEKIISIYLKLEWDTAKKGE